MLYIQDEIAKLGGLLLPGIVKAVEITESAIIDEVKDDKGKLKAVQPLGYESGKVNISLELEETETRTVMQQLADIQRLFKPDGQEVPILIPIVNEDCAARGVNEVYFKSITSKSVTAETKATATLEFIVPVITGIKVEALQAQEAISAAVSNAQTAVNMAFATVKNFTNSPAADTANTITALDAAAKCLG